MNKSKIIKTGLRKRFQLANSKLAKRKCFGEQGISPRFPRSIFLPDAQYDIFGQHPWVMHFSTLNLRLLSFCWNQRHYISDEVMRKRNTLILVSHIFLCEEQ